MTALPGEARQFMDALLRLDSAEAGLILARARGGKEGLALLDEIVVPALERIGSSWEEGKVALSQVYMAGRICEEILGELAPAAPVAPGQQPRLAIAVLEDHHALGKRMVKSALRAAGHQVADYGAGCRAAQLVELALRDRIEVLLVSCLMLASAVRVRDVVEGLRQAGSQTAVVVGGAPFRLDRQLWREVGAQAMGVSSVEAVSIVQSMTGGRS